MKILFVHNGLGAGGAERSLAELLPGLISEGIEPIVLCFYRRTEGVEADVLASGVDVRFLGAHRLVNRALAVRRIIRQERPDIVHTSIFEANLAGRLGSAAMSPVVLSSLVNTPYIPTRRRDPNVSRFGMTTAHVADGWTARHLCDHFHALTHAVKDWAVGSLRLDPASITVVERGRDPRRLGEPSVARRRESRRALGLTDETRVILNVGRQEYQKGQRFLLEAMPAVRSRDPRAVLLIAGRKGNASDDLQALKQQLGIDDETVRFLGHHEDIPSLLAAADVFAFPSLFEGLGGALIEAMALGLPVIASDVPAVAEVVEAGRSGLLVPPASATDLAAAIGEVLGDDGMAREFGARGREIFIDRFTLSRSTARMIELYRTLADRSMAEASVARRPA
jgi:glycosyltransferase involved in cell wall biosynthesis